MLSGIVILSVISTVLADPLRLWNADFAKQYAPHSYERPVYRASPLSDKFQQNFDAINYSPQGMKDLGELGDLVGSGDPNDVALLRPYYSMVDMTANGNKQGFGSYLHVLPDEEEGDKPIYSVGGSMGGGIEPAGMKHGYMGRMFG